MSPHSPQPEERQPVVTGLGAVCAIGVGIDAFWQAIHDGKNGVQTVRSFDASGLRNHVGCEVDNERLAEVAEDSWQKLPRASRLAATAGREALVHSGLEAGQVEALCNGTTTGDLPHVEDRLTELDVPANSELISWVVNDNFAGRIGEALGVRGPALTVATSCSAGNIAISRAVDLIQNGQAERVLAGGTDAFSKLAFIGFSRMRAMAYEMCTPFALKRFGMLLGEGAGFLMVESLASARQRGAQIYARILGYGLSCDAYHIATPAPNGRGAAAAMRRALASSGVKPEDVDYVSAHGTGTVQNDKAESKACSEVFGEHRPYVSSLKALVGHCLGAASALEAVASILSLRDQRLVPAWNVREQDPICDVRLPFPEEIPETYPLEVVASNALAFGGNNSCLVLQRHH